MRSNQLYWDIYMRWLGLVAVFFGVAGLYSCSGKGKAAPDAPLYAVYGLLLTFSFRQFAAGLTGGAVAVGADGHKAGTIGLDLSELKAQATEMYALAHVLQDPQ